MEFFAGEANCFAEVKKLYGATAVDIEYLKYIGGPKSNAFDILTQAGLALLVLMPFWGFKAKVVWGVCFCPVSFWF